MVRVPTGAGTFSYTEVDTCAVCGAKGIALKAYLSSGEYVLKHGDVEHRVTEWPYPDQPPPVS